MVKKPSKPNKVILVHTTDVTKEFFSKCSDLKTDEIIFKDDIKLADLMHSLEITQEKDNNGINRNNISVDALTKKGFFNTLKVQHVLAIIDKTFSLYVSYLRGGHSEKTVYTNILLHYPTKTIPNKTLGVINKAFSYLIPLTRAIMEASHVVEPEEFSLDISSFMTPAGEWMDIKRMIQSLDKEYLHKANKLQLSKNGDEKYYRAIRERLVFLRLFIELLDVTVPPLDLNTLQLRTTYLRPQISLAIKFLDILNELMQKITRDLKTTLVGSSTGGTWLDIITFINTGHPMASISRNVSCFSSSEAFEYLSDLISILSNKMRLIQPNISSLLECCETRVYNGNPQFLDRLTFFRAYIQFLLQPNNDLHILGQYQLKSLIRQALIDGHCHLAEYEYLMRCPLLENFVNQAAECYLDNFQLYGLNWARQHQLTPSLIEKWIGLIEEASKLDMDWCLSSQKKHEISMGYIVQMQIENLTNRYFELSLSLGLLDSHEYGPIYWFYNEAILRMRKDTGHHVLTGIILSGRDTIFPLGARAADTIDQNRKMTEHEYIAAGHLHKRYQRVAEELRLLDAEESMCISIIYLSFALRRLGHLSELEYGHLTEHQIYNIRINSYKWLHCIGLNADVSFENWKEETIPLYKWEISRIWEGALNCLKDAESKLAECRNDKLEKEKEKLYEIIRYNMLMCQLMTVHEDNWKRKMELVLVHPMDKFPTLKFIHR